MLSPIMVRRIKSEVPEGGFELEETEAKFLDMARYMHDELKAPDDDIINMLHDLYAAVGAEYGA